MGGSETTWDLVAQMFFFSLQRGPGGSFDDADIANYLQSATESAASSFKARGIPSVLRVIEIMGIEQGRAWGACSLNEFRKFLGLKRKSLLDDA